jgi:hypothetical protein
LCQEEGEGQGNRTDGFQVRLPRREAGYVKRYWSVERLSPYRTSDRRGRSTLGTRVFDKHTRVGTGCMRRAGRFQ